MGERLAVEYEDGSVGSGEGDGCCGVVVLGGLVVGDGGTAVGVSGSGEPVGSESIPSTVEVGSVTTVGGFVTGETAWSTHPVRVIIRAISVIFSRFMFVPF